MFFVAAATRTGEVQETANEYEELQEALGDVLLPPEQGFRAHYLHPGAADPDPSSIVTKLNKKGHALVVFMASDPPLVPEPPKLMYKKIWLGPDK